MEEKPREGADRFSVVAAGEPFVPFTMKRVPVTMNCAYSTMKRVPVTMNRDGGGGETLSRAPTASASWLLVNPTPYTLRVVGR